MSHFSDQVILLILWLVESLRHYVEQQLELVTLDLNIGS
jgi:hypothetical protein